MTSVGKFILLAGLLLVVFGAAVWGLGKLGFRGLPGDIAYESNGTRIHFPIVTMVVLSIELTILINLVIWIMRWMGR